MGFAINPKRLDGTDDIHYFIKTFYILINIYILLHCTNLHNLPAFFKLTLVVKAEGIHPKKNTID